VNSGGSIRQCSGSRSLSKRLQIIVAPASSPKWLSAWQPLAALGFVRLLHHTSLGTPFTPEARRLITWSFVGLTALDTMLLLV
jgi:hypothetical protein